MRSPNKKKFASNQVLDMMNLLKKLREKLRPAMLGLPLLLLLLVLMSLIAEQEVKYAQTVFPRVFLNYRSYTGLDRNEARGVLEAEISQLYGGGLKLIYEDKTFAADLEELQFGIDAEKSLAGVFAFGHRASPWASVREQLALLGGDVHFQNQLNESEKLFTDAKWAELSRLETPARNFSYAWNGRTFAPVESAAGYLIDQEKLRADLLGNLRSLRNDPIPITLRKSYPLLKNDPDTRALRQAQQLTERGVILTFGKEEWKVPADDFGHWIAFEPIIGPDGNASLQLAPRTERIRSFLANLAPSVNRDPVNAELQLTGGKIGVFALSREGAALNLEASSQRIVQEIFQTDNYAQLASAAPGTPGSRIELAVDRVAPAVTTESINNLGLTSLLSTGESDFHGSTKSREHNVAIGASKFNGVLIAPGATFSFDQTLGDVGPDTGYLPELVIKKGQTLAEYGGGLCQVSTTAFRAAVNAGLEVTKRSNHAYAVKYYAPQGTDATIYPPDPDLQFVNNTPASILIQTRVKGTKLYFDFYGTSDNRKVVLEGPVVYERGTGGALKTWWKQTVYNQDGSQLLTKTFYSNYKSAELYPLANSSN